MRTTGEQVLLKTFPGNSFVVASELLMTKLPRRHRQGVTWVLLSSTLVGSLVIDHCAAKEVYLVLSINDISIAAQEKRSDNADIFVATWRGECRGTLRTDVDG